MKHTDNDIFVRTRFLFPSLTKSEKVVAQILLEEGSQLINYTLAELSQKADCSEASILRFCRKLGMDGYAELKEQLAEITNSTYEAGAYRIGTADNLHTVFQKVAWYYEKTLKDTLLLYTDEYEKAYEAIRQAKSVHFFGVGDAWIVCESARLKFARIGVYSTAYHDSVMMNATASLLGEGDVAIAISYSGDTRSVVSAMQQAQENGATTICVVHMEKSKVAKYSDIRLFTATTDLTIGHDEIARRVAEHVIVESLYMALVTREAEKYSKRLQKTISTIIANK